ncbi:carbohydrate ABC transporter permease [Caldicellulosiruptoraceae bacterium PP1]
MAKFQGTKINPTKFDKSQLGFIIFLSFLGFFMILPIIFMFSQAFKPIDELFLYPPRFLVKKPTIKNFVDLFIQTNIMQIPMTRYLFNSILITLTNVFLTSIISTMAGFALSKKEFRLKKIIFEANTIALMFVPAAVAIPRYLIVEKMGLIDNMLGHILPILAYPVCVFLAKQFIDQVPNALIEAAYIDGAGDFYLFTRLVLPMIKPAVATISILAFQTTWNNTETSVIYMNKETLKTFAFYMSTLASTVNNNVAGQGIAAAAALIMFIPNLVIFLVQQSKVIATMAHSGLK